MTLASRSSRPSRTATVSALVLALGVTTVAGCDTTGDGVSGAGGQSGAQRLETDGPEVLADANGSGVDVSKRLFEKSDAVVVSSAQRDDQLQAAAIAAQLGAPMLVRASGSDEEVDAEISRLGAERIIEVPVAAGNENNSDVAEIEPVQSADEGDDIAAIAAQDAANPRNVVMPPMLATASTSPAAVATARAAGADVEVLEVADPRATTDSIRLVSEQDTLALGEDFGSSEDYRALVDLADNGELPGGGGLVFPGRRMIALYGHPYGPELGVMGEQSPEEAAALAKEYASSYEPFADEPIIPAFEIIVTVASEFPGEDGNFSNETPAEDIEPYVDAIIDAGGYAVIDLQPGQGSFLEQAKAYEDLLRRPNVGLALDAEWKLNPGEAPLSRIGSAAASEINEVADWLAELIRDNDLPQKAFVLHQFNISMFPDRENIGTEHPELAYVLHADGHGVPEQKFDTWNVLREELDPNFYMAWKNFIDEDTPMFTPEQTFDDVNPRPWFVSYQ